MAIKVQDLLSEKARKFGASESSTDFQQLFVDCLNYALDDIDETLGLATSRVTSTSGSIDVDQPQYRGLISFGLDFYIADQGEWAIQPSGNLERRWKDKLAMTQMNLLKDESTFVGGIGDVDSTD
ncbi:MAG: hypothetical protein GWN80_11470 [Gammaproteobacteria bacterium]|nr:hypothetical protein [Gammaproteobacteria bacterium]